MSTLEHLIEAEDKASKLKLGDLDGIADVLDNLDWQVDLLGFTEEQQRFLNTQNKLIGALTAYLLLVEAGVAINKINIGTLTTKSK